MKVASRVIRPRPANINTSFHGKFNGGITETGKNSDSTSGVDTTSSKENREDKQKKGTSNKLTSTLTGIARGTTPQLMKPKSAAINNFLFGPQTAKKRAADREEKRKLEEKPKFGLELAIGTIGTTWHLATLAKYPLVDASKHEFKNEKRKLLHKVMSNLNLTQEHSKNMRDLILQNNAIQDRAGCDLVKKTITWFVLHVCALETANPHMIYALSQQIHGKIGEAFKNGGQPAGHRLHQLGSARDIVLNTIYGTGKQETSKKEVETEVEPTSPKTP